LPLPAAPLLFELLVLFELVLLPIKPPVWFVSLLLAPVGLVEELFGLVLLG